MPKYLRTTGISNNLEDLIRKAREKLYIISPYLKLSDSVKELLNDKERGKTEVRIIFGKDDLNPTEMAFLQSLSYVRLYFHKNLHAKCYLNEKQMIISSMNLYEFSQVNNKEMGILIERENEADRLVYEEALEDIMSILNNSTEVSKSIQVIAKEPIVSKISARNSNPRPMGYCIRTRVEIHFNVDKPMCNDAFRGWNQYGDPDYPERFCHFSGEHSNGETSMNFPILKKNWKKAKEIFDL